jgi:hypothetical protein
MTSAHRRPSAVIDYRFRQPFRVPARTAFAWATDYTESDWAIAGITGVRGVEHVSPTMIRLTDRTRGPSGPGETKVRIVQLYPETLSWVSTHVTGPCLHSQFRYSITRTGRRTSALIFQGREIRWEARPSGLAELKRLRSQLRAEDVLLWKRFARAMAMETLARK